jgi:PCFT/HCP family folate transporter-like MFS transporter 1/3
MQQKHMGEESIENKPLVTPTLPRWWRVLPCLFILMNISTIDNLILNDFIEYRYATYYQVNSSSRENAHELCLNASGISHNSSHLISTTTSKYPISTTMSPDDLIQEANARLSVFISLAATIPSILTATFLGSNCDRIGRKPLIVLPYIGKVIRYFILTAVAYYNLADLWIVLAVMFDSIFGTGALNILSSFAYVTDCTTAKTRTSAIIVTDVCIGASRLIPLLTIGIYLQHPNFIQSMLFTLLLSVAGFVFCVVLQPESNLNVQHLNFLRQLGQVKFKTVIGLFRVFFVKREGHKQRSLLMLVTIHLSIIVMICGQLSMYYIYLYGAPFCFNSFDVSLNSVAQTVTVILLTVPFTLTIAKRTDHLVLPMLGCLALMAQLILFGIATEVWMLYLAVCVGAVFNVLSPVIRSRITKLVEPNEYAVVFILAMIVESGGYYAISALGNEIYAVSITFLPGLVNFVFAMVGVLAIMLSLYVKKFHDAKTQRLISFSLILVYCTFWNIDRRWGNRLYL